MPTFLVCQDAVSAKLDALPSVLVRAEAFEREHALPFRLFEVVDAPRDVLGVEATADGLFAAGYTGFLTVNDGGHPRTDVFDVAVRNVGEERLQVFERIVAGNERVAGIEIAPLSRTTTADAMVSK